MAIKFMDSFDHYGGDFNQMAQGTYLGVGPGGGGGTEGVTNTRARTGIYSFHLGNGGGFRRVIAERPYVAGAGMSIWFDGLPGVSNRATPLYFADRDLNAQVTLGIDTTGAINVLANGATLATSAPVLTSGAWQHLEARVKVGVTDGEVEVRVNGVTVVALSGVHTQASGSAHAEVAQIGVSAGLGVTPTPFFVDDIFIWDDSGDANNDFIGDRRVLTQFADQDTTTADFQKSSGVNGYALINENPPDNDGSYIFADPAQVGAKSAFEFQELGPEVSAVTAVMVSCRSIKTDAGSCNLQVSMIAASNEALGADNAITSVYTDRQDVFEVNPDTGAPWTRDQVNAALIAVKRTL